MFAIHFPQQIVTKYFNILSSSFSYGADNFQKEVHTTHRTKPARNRFPLRVCSWLIPQSIFIHVNRQSHG